MEENEKRKDKMFSMTHGVNRRQVYRKEETVRNETTINGRPFDVTL